jgi:hypothetical protein
MKCDLCPNTIYSATEHYNFTIRSNHNEVGDQLDISCCNECAKRLIIPCLATIKLMREATEYIKERNKPTAPKKKECYHGPGMGCENCFGRKK